MGTFGGACAARKPPASEADCRPRGNCGLAGARACAARGDSGGGRSSGPPPRWRAQGVARRGARLFAVPNFGPHAALLSTEFPSTFTRFLRAHSRLRRNLDPTLENLPWGPPNHRLHPPQSGENRAESPKPRRTQDCSIAGQVGAIARELGNGQSCGGRHLAHRSAPKPFPEPNRACNSRNRITSQDKHDSKGELGFRASRSKCCCNG